MKLGFFIIFACLFSSEVLSQHTYTDPRKRQKRPLLEEPLQETPASASAELEDGGNAGNSSLTKNQQLFCACEKVYFLSLKRANLRDALARKGLIKNEWRQQSEFRDHREKAKEAMLLKRGQYEIEEGFDCNHQNLAYKKIGEYTKAIRGLVGQCDIEIITE